MTLPDLTPPTPVRAVLAARILGVRILGVRILGVRILGVLVLGVLVLGVLVLPAACSSAVDVTVPPYAGTPACEQASRSWPEKVGGQARVAVSGGPPAVAAWGDPAVIARCGVTAVGPTTDDCLDVDGAQWVVRRLADGAQFTSYGTDPAIEVLVPAAYAPEPLLLPAFAAAAKDLPGNGRRCQ